MFEMSRTFRTLIQSLISPVLSTALYFIVFGTAIGNNINYKISGSLKGANEIMQNGVFWGSSPGMNKKEINHVIKTVRSFFND